MPRKVVSVPDRPVIVICFEAQIAPPTLSVWVVTWPSETMLLALSSVAVVVPLVRFVMAAAFALMLFAMTCPLR